MGVNPWTDVKRELNSRNAATGRTHGCEPMHNARHNHGFKPMAKNNERPTMSNLWNAKQYETNARFVSELGMPVVSLLAPASGERILDLGCGDGALTAELCKLGCMVTGIDPSEDFVRAAIERGIDAKVADARNLDMREEFDAVFSNAVLHWIPESQLVSDNVFRALKPGGRFVGEFGGHGNIAAIMTSLVATLRYRGIEPAKKLGWYYPTVDEYTRVLEGSGFAVEAMELIPRPTSLPTGMEGWLRTFRGSYLKEMLGDDSEDALTEIIDNLRFSLCDDSGNWIADYVRLRFKAIKLG
jgi:trans-aconitate methyltransferase